ncbi:MAG TPA: hypothetical protein VMT24_07085 [Aggregatilineaceae bacterium]|nr:hypothetical protein [Aggregatilineaceae bacterium]
MSNDFEKARRWGIALALSFWISVILVAAVIPPASDWRMVIGLLLIASYLGLLAATYLMDRLSAGVLGILPRSWLVLLLVCPFAALPVFLVWKPNPVYIPPYPQQCPVCRRHAVQSAKLTIYTAYYSSRVIQHSWWSNTTKYRVTHSNIWPHEFHLCRACQRQNKISLAIMLALAVISVGGLALIPSIQANTLHRLVAALGLAGLLAAFLVYARWGDVGSKIKKQAVLLRTNGGPGLNVVALSQKEYERLKRRAARQS